MAKQPTPTTEEPKDEEVKAETPPEAVPEAPVEEKVVYEPDCASGRK